MVRGRTKPIMNLNRITTETKGVKPLRMDWHDLPAHQAAWYKDLTVHVKVRKLRPSASGKSTKVSVVKPTYIMDQRDQLALYEQSE